MRYGNGPRIKTRIAIDIIALVFHRAAIDSFWAMNLLAPILPAFKKEKIRGRFLVLNDPFGGQNGRFNEMAECRAQIGIVWF